MLHKRLPLFIAVCAISSIACDMYRVDCGDPSCDPIQTFLLYNTPGNSADDACPVGDSFTISTPTNVQVLAGQTLTSGSTDGAGTAAQFNQPTGLASDGENLYVADSANKKIRTIDIDTAEVTTIAGTGADGVADGDALSATFGGPADLALDSTCTKLYIVDQFKHNIRLLNLTTDQVSTVAGGTLGTADGIGTAAQFNNPVGLGIEGDTLYVADEGNNVIRNVDLNTTQVTTIAGDGTLAELDGTLLASQFIAPSDVVAANGKLYVVTNGETVRELDLTGNSVTTVAGQANITANVDGIGTAALFATPESIIADSTYLYVAQQNNDAIRRAALSNFNVVTIAGTGTEGDTDGAATSAQFRNPLGMGTDGQQLFAAESSAHRVRIIN